MGIEPNGGWASKPSRAKAARKPAAPKPTLRDEFAMAALIGYISQPANGSASYTPSDSYLAERAYAVADAMLIERAKAGKA